MFLYARRRQGELARLREEVAENQHLAAVGRLAGSVAHEVRKPPFRGRAAWCSTWPRATNRAPAPTNAPRPRCRRWTDWNGWSPACWTTPVPRSPRLISMDLHESIAGTLRLLADEPRSQGVEIISRLDQDLPLVKADPDQVRQILMNLIINALEANNGTGQVTVATHRHGRQARVVVSDQGPGLPPGKSEEIFDPVLQHQGKRQRTGLGHCTPPGPGHGRRLGRRIGRGARRRARFTLTLISDEAQA